MGYPLSGLTPSFFAGAVYQAGKEKACAAGRKVKETYTGISNEIGMHKKEISIALGVVALVAIAAGAAIYNREAIKDFAQGQYNHIVGGAQAGDTPTIGGKPVMSSLCQDANGTWGWHPTS